MWAAIGECKSADHRLSSRRAEATALGRTPAAIIDCVDVAHSCTCSKSAAKSPLQVAVADLLLFIGRARRYGGLMGRLRWTPNVRQPEPLLKV
jgi:hypothetical protein